MGCAFCREPLCVLRAAAKKSWTAMCGWCWRRVGDQVVVAKLKVWGGLVMRSDLGQQYRQYRHIVAATSQRRAVEILCSTAHRRCATSLYEFRGYWAETGNESELAVAAREGVWFTRDDRSSMGTYVEEPSVASPRGPAQTK